MANRDFKKIERIMKDFSLGVGEGESGGLIKVDKLPEVGKEGVLYQTPDGKYYTCTNTTETKTICDLEVGKSYKLNSEILLSDFYQFLDNYDTYSFPFNEEGNVYIEAYGNDGKTHISYFVADYSVEPEVYHIADFEVPVGYTQEKVAITLIEFTEIPSVEITQYFAETIQQDNVKLEEFAFLFEGGSHTETTTTSTWEELGGKNKYFEFPNEETFKLEFYPQKFLDVLVKLNIDIDAEMETMLTYLTSGGIYIGSGALSYASSEGHHADAFYASIYATEGSGNSETFFSLMAGDYEPIAYSSDAYTIEEPFTIKKLIETLGDVCITEGANLSDYRNTVLAPRIGIKTGSSSNDTTWYDCSLEDMQSFLKVIPSND